MKPLQTPFALQQALHAQGIVTSQADALSPLNRLASLEQADGQSLAFLSDRRYLRQAQRSAAGVILIPQNLLADLQPCSAHLVVVDQPYQVFARISQWVAALIETQRQAQHAPAAAALAIHPQARIAPDAWLGPGVVVGAGSHVGAGARLEAHCVIGRDCHIGAGSRLYPHVVVYDDCSMGDRAIVHSGTVIGSDGFGFARGADGWIKIAQLGAVRIGDDVEIGSNCSIDRGTLEDTVIEDGCKLDNLIQVAHNVQIGAQSVLAACVGIAGSARLGRRCLVGGSVGILGHLSICDDVTITPMSLVMSGIDKPGVYSGSSPLMAHRDWEKSAAIQRSLPEWRARLRALESLSKNKSNP